MFLKYSRRYYKNLGMGSSILCLDQVYVYIVYIQSIYVHLIRANPSKSYIALRARKLHFENSFNTKYWTTHSKIFIVSSVIFKEIFIDKKTLVLNLKKIYLFIKLTLFFINKKFNRIIIYLIEKSVNFMIYIDFCKKILFLVYAIVKELF